MKKLFYLFLLFFGLGEKVFALDTLKLDGRQQEYLIGQYTSYYEDKSGKLNFRKVLKPDFEDKFKAINSNALRFGISKSAHWLHIKIKSLEKDHSTYVLFFSDPSLYRVDAFVMDENRHIHHFRGGLAVAQSEKIYRGSRACFPIDMLPNQTLDIYLRVVSLTVLTIDCRLSPEIKFNNDFINLRTYLGAFYGIIGIIIFYNLILYFSVKLISFLYFVLYTFFFSFITGAFDGFTAEYFPYLLYLSGGYYDIYTITLSHIFLLLFVRSYLETKKQALLFDRLSFVYSHLLTAICLFSFFNAALALQYIIDVSMLVMVFILWACLLAWNKKNREGYFFLAAFGILGLSGFLSLLMVLRIIPPEYATQYGLHIGYILHLFVLSLGLSDKIASIRKELIQKEQEKQAIIDEKNRELEQKVIERTQELSIKETKLRSILESIDASIWLLNDKYEIIEFNSTFAETLKRMEGVGIVYNQNIIDQAHKQEDKIIWKKLYDKTLLGEPQIYVMTYWLGEEKRIIETRTFPIIDKGQIIGVSAYAKNIVKEREREEALKQINAHFKGVLESTQDIIFALDTQYCYLTFNEKHRQAMKHIYGLDIEIGKNILDYMQVHGDDTKAKNDIDRAFKGEQYIIEQIYGNEALTRTYFEASYNPIFDENNEIVGVAVFVRNMTDSKRAEDRIRQNELLLNSINQNISEAIYRSTPQGDLLYANQAMSKMFGYASEEEIIGTNIVSFYDKAERRSKLIKILNANKSYFNEEVLFRRKDKSKFWGLISCIKTEDDRGNIYYDGAIRNISETKKAEKKLKKQNEKLKKINSELDRFVYSASHDLRAPLASILGLIDISKEEKDETIRDKYYDLMLKSVGKLDNFIRQIIQYSRNSRIKIKKELIDFEEIIHTVFDNLKFMDEAAKIEKIIQIDTETPFYSDLFRLNIIFNNIISNAIRYYNPYQEKPFIKIHIQTSPKNVWIEIKDNGQGIDAKYIDKIFDMFFKASQNASGSGLGLYIVKETLQVLKGNIEVQSEINVGTTFSIEIPNLEFQPKIEVHST